MKLYIHIYYKLFFYVILALSSINISGQVSIGSINAPENGALLQLKTQEADIDFVTAQKGLLLPRVNLESVKSLKPVLTESGALNQDSIDLHIGLTVYNLTKDQCKLTPGFYTWTQQGWQYIISNNYGILQADDESNSFIVLPGYGIDIPVKKAYEFYDTYKLPDGTSLPKPSLTDKVSASLIWQDRHCLISDIRMIDADQTINAYLRVIPSHGDIPLTGNALVAVHIGPNGDNSDPIYWSWHIWFTHYDPNNGGETYQIEYGGFLKNTFMSLNMGATEDTSFTSGMHYQWGRKDPFPADKAFTENGTTKKYVAFTLHNDTIWNITSKTATVQNLNYSIKNPLEYIQEDAGGNNTDWFTNSILRQDQDDTLWDVQGKKSLFDPCPKGWRVPAAKNMISPWSKAGLEKSENIQNNISNVSFNNGVNVNMDDFYLGFLPADGYRTEDGVIGAGTELLYSTASGSNKQKELINMLYVEGAVYKWEPYTPWNRANASSVRCVRE